MPENYKTAVSLDAYNDLVHEFNSVKEAAENFRIAIIESGTLNHVPQDKYISQLRALEAALATCR